MTRKLWSILAVLMLSAVAVADEAALDARLALLRTDVVDEMAFVEERHSQILAEPAVFRGILRYEPVSGVMQKIVQSPEPVTMRVDDRYVSVQRDGKSRRLSLRSHPELGALMAGFRGLLQGDTDSLAKHFELDYREQQDGWTLHMTPRNKRLKRHVEVMIVDGGATGVGGICTRMTNGDWQHMSLSPTGPQDD